MSDRTREMVLEYFAMVDAIRDEEQDYQLRKRGWVYEDRDDHHGEGGKSSRFGQWEGIKPDGPWGIDGVQ